MNGGLQLTYARWCNRYWADGAKPAKVLAHGGPYTQFAYGTFTESTWATGTERAGKDGRLYTDGPLQTAVICSEWAWLLGVDVDRSLALTEGSQTGKFLARDDAWCTRGDGFHSPWDMRGIDPELWPKQGATGWGDIKNKGFLPRPGDLHYSGEPYAPTWKSLYIPKPDAVVALEADRAAHHEAMKAARDAARAAISAGDAPERVADAARTAAFSFAHGAVAAGSHREILLALLWECGVAGLTDAEAWAQWQLYAAPWDAARPWTRDHFANMWHDVPRKVAEMREKQAEKLAAVPVAQSLNGSSSAVPLIGRERFYLGNRADAAERLDVELGRGPLAGLFLRDGLIVHTPRVGEEGYVLPTEKEKKKRWDHGPAQVRPVTTGHVKTLVELKYDVGHIVTEEDGSKTWVHDLFPQEVAQHSVNAAELGYCPNLEQLAGVTHTPIMRPDGTVLDQPGYDADTGLLYLPTGGLVVATVPEHPSAEQIRDAVALLREPIALFPWVEPHHEANYLGAMFTPVLRLLLPPPYQMAIITATNRGSGKGFLMRMLGIPHGIVMRGEFPREREELRKLIFSTLFTTTAPIIGFDNIRGTIYSSELESLLTTPTLNDRVLGVSRNADVHNDRLWVATGNNARISGDLDRRCLPIALDPQCADPHKRKFAFNPVEWMTTRRGDYLAALLTVARGWIQAGAPKADPERSDDYAQWYAALRGLLNWAGEFTPDGLGVFGAEDTGDRSVQSEDDADWADFVAELFWVFGGAEFTSKDVVAKLQTPLSLVGRTKINADTLPGDLTEKWEKTTRYGTSKISFTKSLGKWLSYRDGKFTPDELAVRMPRDRTSARTSIYQVVRPAGWPTWEDFLAQPSDDTDGDAE